MWIDRLYPLLDDRQRMNDRPSRRLSDPSSTPSGCERYMAPEQHYRDPWSWTEATFHAIFASREMEPPCTCGKPVGRQRVTSVRVSELGNYLEHCRVGFSPTWTQVSSKQLRSDLRHHLAPRTSSPPGRTSTMGVALWSCRPKLSHGGHRATEPGFQTA